MTIVNTDIGMELLSRARELIRRNAYRIGLQLHSSGLAEPDGAREPYLHLDFGDGLEFRIFYLTARGKFSRPCDPDQLPNYSPTTLTNSLAELRNILKARPT